MAAVMAGYLLLQLFRGLGASLDQQSRGAGGQVADVFRHARFVLDRSQPGPVHQLHRIHRRRFGQRNRFAGGA